MVAVLVRMTEGLTEGTEGHVPDGGVDDGGLGPASTLEDVEDGDKEGKERA